MNAIHGASIRRPCGAGRLTGRGAPAEAQLADGTSDLLGTEDQQHEPHDIGEGARALLQANTVCVVSTLMSDGSPHASAVHFAADGRTEYLYICINKRSQTAQSIPLDGRAAITIGTDPRVPKALQMRGRVAITPEHRLEAAQREFYARFPSSASYKDDPCTVFADFTPTWLRYSDGISHKQFFVRGFSSDLVQR